MTDIKTYFKSYKSIVWVCFALFALSPCTAKEALFLSVGVDYVKPANKTKTTVSSSTCVYLQNEVQQICFVKKTTIHSLFNPASLMDNQDCFPCFIGERGDYSKLSTGVSLPKYILFKRLKIDVV